MSEQKTTKVPEEKVRAEKWRSFELLIGGIPGSPLVTNRFHADAAKIYTELYGGREEEGIEQESEKKRMKKRQKMTPSPFFSFYKSMYWISKEPKKPTMKQVENGVFGIKPSAIKASLVMASKLSSVQVKGRDVAGCIWIHAGNDSSNPLYSRITNSKPIMTEEMVRLPAKQYDGKGPPQMRYRGGFLNWRARIIVDYDENQFSRAEVLELINVAGSKVGLHEGRPERKSSHGWGRYTIYGGTARG